jgi:hypothetical protein
MEKNIPPKLIPLEGIAFVEVNIKSLETFLNQEKRKVIRMEEPEGETITIYLQVLPTKEPERGRRKKRERGGINLLK